MRLLNIKSSVRNHGVKKTLYQIKNLMLHLKYTKETCLKKRPIFVLPHSSSVRLSGRLGNDKVAHK
jgi:hypothetical protein